MKCQYRPPPDCKTCVSKSNFMWIRVKDNTVGYCCTELNDEEPTPEQLKYCTNYKKES